jgi:pimeloyl-ACP methyl ester carboxylesterase
MLRPSPEEGQDMLHQHINGCDMAYIEVGEGSPLVCVHGSLCDSRIWSCVLGPLSRRHPVIAPSLRHFFGSTGMAPVRTTPWRSMSPT